MTSGQKGHRTCLIAIVQLRRATSLFCIISLTHKKLLRTEFLLLRRWTDKLSNATWPVLPHLQQRRPYHASALPPPGRFLDRLASLLVRNVQH
ncbi:hypothetical protein F5Y17DRAFT_125576 [Xylariaceae sp. FL0594]|nr:hypothetical protein F5Y17DRAFT_125576 [Xylariaceae sp. FL0594]